MLHTRQTSQHLNLQIIISPISLLHTRLSLNHCCQTPPVTICYFSNIVKTTILQTNQHHYESKKAESFEVISCWPMLVRITCGVLAKKLYNVWWWRKKWRTQVRQSKKESNIKCTYANSYGKRHSKAIHYYSILRIYKKRY